MSPAEKVLAKTGHTDDFSNLSLLVIQTKLSEQAKQAHSNLREVEKLG